MKRKRMCPDCKEVELDDDEQLCAACVEEFEYFNYMKERDKNDD